VRKMMVVGLVAASLGLASCGVKASMDQAVSSLGASADLQVHLTASSSGPGAQTAEVQKALGALSLDMHYSNPSGAPLSQSDGTANAELIVNTGTQAIVDIRADDSNVYVLVNVSALADIPGVNLPASELSALQLVIGGRWFELPKTLLDTYLPNSASAKAASIKDQADEQKILDALSTVIADTKYTTLPNGGYSETGTLESIVKALLPAIDAISGKTVPSSPVKGTYTLSVTASGSTATGASISITAPSGTTGNATIGLQATIAHANDGVVAPTGATVITPSLLKGLISQAS
jgi:hypothetical protein